MSKRGNRARELRALWATLAVIALLGAGAAFGATRYGQIEVERDATRDAHRLAVDVLQPLLLPSDTQSPIRGARYEELLASVREGVLAGPINGIRLWRADGTILFSDESALVGTREPAMRDDLHAAIAGTSQGGVIGDRFRTLTSLRVGDPPAVVAVELDQSHAALVETARERWYPWMDRALAAAAVFAALWVATAIVAGLLRVFRHKSAPTGAPAAAAIHRDGAVTLPLRAVAAPGNGLPGYMEPGFQEQVEARRRAEDELELAREERDALRERVRQLEAQMQTGDGRPPEPERDGRGLPFGDGLRPARAGGLSSAP
jgi:hypothetical protein